MNNIEPSPQRGQRQFLILERTSTDVASWTVDTPERQATHVHFFAVGDSGCGHPVEEHEEPLVTDEGLSLSPSAGALQSSEVAQENFLIPVGRSQVLYPDRDGGWSLREA